MVAAAAAGRGGADRDVDSEVRRGGIAAGTPL